MPSKCSSNPHELQCVDDNLCINVPKRKYITNSNLKRNLQCSTNVELSVLQQNQLTLTVEG
jgi:hypothetical protein